MKLKGGCEVWVPALPLISRVIWAGYIPVPWCTWQYDGSLGHSVGDSAVRAFPWRGQCPSAQAQHCPVDVPVRLPRDLQRAGDMAGQPAALLSCSSHHQQPAQLGQPSETTVSSPLTRQQAPWILPEIQVPVSEVWTSAPVSTEALRTAWQQLLGTRGLLATWTFVRRDL